jgi:hypothetical protein
MDSGRRVVLVVDTTGSGVAVEPQEADTAAGELVESALCR